MKRVYEGIVIDRNSSRVTVESHVSDEQALCKTEEVTLKVEIYDKEVTRRWGIVMKPDEVICLITALNLASMSFGKLREDANAQE
jgi:hypothetical protein